MLDGQTQVKKKKVLKQYPTTNNLVSMYVTRHLILFYISTKIHKNISKGIQLTEQTQNQCIITIKYNKGR